LNSEKKNVNGSLQLKRKFGVFTATSIVVANMIGAGIFTTSGLMARQLPGPAWVLICWLLGGLISLSGALCYAELATRMPEEGGEYIYLKKLYHPLLGFLTGWTSFFVGFSAPIAGSALAFSEYVFGAFNTQLIDIDNNQLIYQKKILAIIIIIVFTLIHYLGVRWGSAIQNILTVLKVLLVLGLASIGLFFSKLKDSFFYFNNDGDGQNLAIGAAMMMVMFAYSGWNASAYIAGEIKNPRKTLPVSLITGTSIVTFLYLFVNIFIFTSIPYASLKGKIPVVELALVKVFGSGIGDLMGFIIGFALLSSLSAFIIIGPRVYFAMAQDRLFFSFASKVHPRYGVPGRSIVIQGCIAVVMVIVGSFEQLIIYLGFALGIFTWLAIAGIFIVRKKGIGEKSAFRIWGYPFVPLFFLSVSLLMMIVAFINRPLESSIAILTVLLGIPFYYLWNKNLKNKS